MSCACCSVDYEKLERDIDAGLLKDVEKAVNELAAEDLYLAGGAVIYCPGCQAAIARLHARLAAQLRKQTLDGIHDLMSRAYDVRNRKETRNAG